MKNPKKNNKKEKIRSNKEEKLKTTVTSLSSSLMLNKRRE